MMRWLKWGAALLGVMLALVIALPFAVNLNDYIPRIESEVSSRLKEPVTIKSLRFAVVPLPHITIAGIGVGKAEDIKLGKVIVTPEISSLFGTTRVMRTVEIDSLVLTQRALARMPLWFKAGRKDDPSPVRIEKIELTHALIKLDDASFGPFDARLQLDETGEPQDAVIATQDGKLKAVLKPGKDGYLVDARAKGWKFPVGAPVVFDELALKGVATVNDARFSEITAALYGGTVSGTANVAWARGMQLNGRFDVSQVELKQLAPLVSPNARVSGRLNAKPVVTAQSQNAEQILQALRIDTPFAVQNGVLHGVDLQKAATSIITKGEKGGETRFDQLSGHLVMERGAYRFSGLKIVSGALSADGNVTISPKKQLAGRINAKVQASVASAGIPLDVSGTVGDPVLLPSRAALAGAAVGTVLLPGVGTGVGMKMGEFAEKLFGGSDGGKAKK